MTIPAVLLGLSTLLGLAPVLFPVALVFDLGRLALTRRPMMASRLLAFALVYLLDEALGLLSLLVIWLGAGLGPGRARRLLDGTYAVQRLWAGVLFEASRLLLGLRYEVEGDEACAPGPVIVFVQHASILDTLVPTRFVTHRHGIRLRFVLKKELLVSPCLDVAGHRLPNVFVDRSSTQTAREVGRIRALATGMGAREGALIYPEGTRATPAKRAHALGKLAASDPALHAKASRLRHVLPPRIGGPLALLEGAPEADCVFVAHRGLEGFAHVADLFGGGLVGRAVRIGMWRVPRAEVPTTEAERVAWLYAQWQRVDDWLERAGASS